MRSEIIDFIKKELIGPDPIKPHIQANGEEILVNEPPRLRYAAGILFPKAASYVRIDTSDNIEKEVIDESQDEGVDDDPVRVEDKVMQLDSTEDYEEEIGLANNYLPSAMGFSCCTSIPELGFTIKITAGVYEVKEYEYDRSDGSKAVKRAYYRIPLDQVINLDPTIVPKVSGKSVDIFLKNKEGAPIAFKLNIRNRTHDAL